jgi:hypothetical protein
MGVDAISERERMGVGAREREGLIEQGIGQQVYLIS